jgi:CheY-like chemotaxis protein
MLLPLREEVEVLHKYLAEADLAEEGGRVRVLSADQKPSVILVDDDAVSAEMYRLGLEQHGFVVAWNADGAELFEAMRESLPDIVVLDWQLPGMNGDEILRRIRLDDRTKALPVLMLSNYPAEKAGEVDRVFLAGALAWLQKVNTPPALLAEKLTEALAG